MEIKEVQNGAGNPEDSQPTPPEEDKKPEEGTPPSPEDKKEAQPKQVPFHEDPAVQDYLERQWSQRETKLRSEIKEEIEQSFGKMTKKESEGDDIPDWFGGDINQWRSFLTHQEGVVERAKKSAIDEFQHNQKLESEKVHEANDWFSSSIQTIESLTGKKVDPNALLAYTLENNGTSNKFVDKHGRWDYVKAFNEMVKSSTNLGKKELDDRKKLADGTMKDGGKAEEGDKTFKTSEDFKKERPW